MAYKTKISGVDSNRSYIGSSSNIKNRFSWHKFILRHNSPALGYGLTRVHSCQEDWNKYREHSFFFEVLEYCDKQYLKDREQFWMDKPEYINRYNKDINAYGNGTRDEDTKRIMSEIAKERNMRPAYNKMISDRAKKQHAEGKLGRRVKLNEGKTRSSYPGV